MRAWTSATSPEEVGVDRKLVPFILRLCGASIRRSVSETNKYAKHCFPPESADPVARIRCRKLFAMAEYIESEKVTYGEIELNFLIASEEHESLGPGGRDTPLGERTSGGHLLRYAQTRSERASGSSANAHLRETVR